MINCSYDIKSFLLQNNLKLRIIGEDKLLVDETNNLTNHVQEIGYWYLNGLKPVRRTLQEVQDIFRAFDIPANNLNSFFNKHKAETYGVCMYSGKYIYNDLIQIFSNFLKSRIGKFNQYPKTIYFI